MFGNREWGMGNRGTDFEAKKMKNSKYLIFSKLRVNS
jgi:hypothetical protein